MVRPSLTAALAVAAISLASVPLTIAFIPVPFPPRVTLLDHLQSRSPAAPSALMSHRDDSSLDGEEYSTPLVGRKTNKSLAAALIASMYLITGTLTGVAGSLEPAAAASPDPQQSSVVADSAPTILLSARSGGRIGGRAAGGGMEGRTGFRGYGGGYGYRGGGTTVIRPPTVVTPLAPPIMVSPFGSPFGFSPFGIGGGFGFGLGSGIREYNQESEIRRSKAELEVYKQREVEMERRLDMLERQQGLQPGAQELQQGMLQQQQAPGTEAASSEGEPQEAAPNK